MAGSPRDIKSVFGQALEQADPVARAAFLDGACAGNSKMREEIEALLVAFDKAAGFLSGSIPADGSTVTFAPDAAKDAFKLAEPNDAITADFPGKDDTVGTVIAGKYKLVEAIGEGGMGSVFLAQQSQPVKRLVAVKVIKAGMDSKAVLARFDAERQALAMMDHPNIAKVLDAGATESGRPFFVMELVKGVPITRFCDDRRLAPKQRLELFVLVCQAIQHAHQKGIIHRDIKPSNVLVSLYDDRPVPKVIDFGVAKATGSHLTDQTLVTGLGAVVGTPEYMSPEQASFNQLDVDTRSDIYGLGVLLYELMTGSTPIDRKSLGKAALLEVLRMVREVEAPRPSNKLSTSDALPSIAANRGLEPKKLTGLLRGELDWILLKALEKDRSRRYETANGFAADVQRYLAGEQVQAVPPSKGYRLKKFFKRHKGPVLAAGMVFFALVAGVVGTTFGLFEANRQAGIAIENEGKANEAAIAERAAKEREAEQRANAQIREAEAVAARRDTQEALYESQLLLLRQALDENNTRRARTILDSMRPKPGELDLRKFEWHFLDRQINGAISQTLIVPKIDGKRMYAVPEVYDNGRVVLFRQTAPNGYTFDAVSYDPATGRLLDGFETIRGTYRVRQPYEQLNILEFQGRNSEPGTRFIHYSTAKSPNSDPSIRIGDVTVWDARTGEKIADCVEPTLPPEWTDEGWKLAFNLTSRFHHLVHLEKYLAGTIATRPSKSDANKFEYRIQIHDLKTGRIVRAFDPQQERINQPQFSPDGSRILFQSITINAASPYQPQFSPDGSRILFQSIPSNATSPNDAVSLAQSTLGVWDIESGKQLWQVRIPPLAKVGFEGQGETVAAVERSDPDLTGRTSIRYSSRFDSTSGKPIQPGGGFSPLTGRRLEGFQSPDGFWKAEIIGNRVEIRSANLLDLRMTLRVDNPVLGAYFQDENRVLRVIESVSEDGVRCSLWPLALSPALSPTAERTPFNLNNFDETATARDGKEWSLNCVAKAVGNDPYSGPIDYKFTLRSDAGTVREIELRDTFSTMSKMKSLAITPEGTRAIVPVDWSPSVKDSKQRDDEDRTGIAILDFERKVQLKAISHPGYSGIWNPTISKDGRKVAYAYQRNNAWKVIVWDIENEREVWSQSFPLQDHFGFLEFLPNDRRVAIGFVWTGEVRLYDAETGKIESTLPPVGAKMERPKTQSYSLPTFFSRWSKNQKEWILGRQGELVILDVETLKILRRSTAESFGEIGDFQYSPDSKHYSIFGSDKKDRWRQIVQIFDTASGQPSKMEPQPSRGKVVFTPDSSRAIWQSDREGGRFAGQSFLSVWDIRQGQLRLPIECVRSDGRWKFNSTGTKLVNGYGLEIDASPLTAEQLIAARPAVAPDKPRANSEEFPQIRTTVNGSTITTYVSGGSEIMNDIYAKDPKSAVDYANLAINQSAKQDLQGSAKSWAEAARLHPKFAPFQHELGVALKSLNRREEALAAFREATKLDPNRAQTWFELGGLLFHMGRQREAIDPLRKALDKDPHHASARNDLGCCLRDIGEVEKSVVEFQRSALCDPKLGYPLRNLGLIALGRGKPDEALEHFQKALGKNSVNWALRNELNLFVARAWKAKKEFKKAEDLLRTQIAQNSNSTEPVLEMGFLHVENGRPDAALDVFREAAKLHPAWLTEPDRNLRYNLACAAVLVSNSALPYSAEHQKALRREALDWLRAEMTEYEKRAKDPEYATPISATMAHWLTDADLESVRSPKGPKAHDADDWEKLWMRVRKLQNEIAPKVEPKK